jgi:uncharacterized protein (TIGR02145 family)
MKPYSALVLIVGGLLLASVSGFQAQYIATDNRSSSVLQDTVSSASLIFDRDGNAYKTVKIGKQWWMAENLRVCSCNDSTKTKALKVGKTDHVNPAIYWYENDANSRYSHIFGPLYNYRATVACDLCPKGWHIPSKDEWYTLLEFWRYFDSEKRSNGKTSNTMLPVSSKRQEIACGLKTIFQPTRRVSQPYLEDLLLLDSGITDISTTEERGGALLPIKTVLI